MTPHTTPTSVVLDAKVSELSVDFDDYHPEARAEHEGKSLFVGVHVPVEYAKHLRLSSVVTIGIEVSA